jgi:hypothetical protein
MSRSQILPIGSDAMAARLECPVAAFPCVFPGDRLVFDRGTHMPRLTASDATAMCVCGGQAGTYCRGHARRRHSCPSVCPSWVIESSCPGESDQGVKDGKRGLRWSKRNRQGNLHSIRYLGRRKRGGGHSANRLLWTREKLGHQSGS